MKNQQDLNLENDQKQGNEDKNTILQVRTKESLKEVFKNINGNTDNEKLIKLLDLYRKFQSNQDKFNIDTNLDVVEKAFNTIKSQIVAISTNVNQYERTLSEKYIVNIADEMQTLKSDIENEEVLKSKIINLEKEIENLSNKLEQSQIKISMDQENLSKIESENKDLINSNSRLVHAESSYINQLREKDSIINSKDNHINELLNVHESKTKALEGEYSAKLVLLEKESLKKEFEITNLKANIENYEVQTKKLNQDIDQLRKDHKEELKEISKDHKKEIKEISSKLNKLEIEMVSKDNEIENLKKQIQEKNSKKVTPKKKD